MIKTNMLYILVSVWMTVTFIQGHISVRKKNKKKKKNFSVHFLTNLSVDLDEIQYVATTCWFVEAHATVILHK